MASECRNPQETPNHLLVAVLEQEGGIVVPVLQRANGDPEGIRRRANEALDKLPKVTGPGQEGGPGFSGDVSALLQRAEDEARGLSDEYVSTEHILLALAADPKIDIGGAPRAPLLAAAPAGPRPPPAAPPHPAGQYQRPPKASPA